MDSSSGPRKWGLDNPYPNCLWKLQKPVLEPSPKMASEEKTMIVYLIRNTINKKLYVGQTCQSLERRWGLHLKAARGKSRFPIHCAIRKYGSKVFTIVEIDRATSRKELNALEARYITEYNSMIPSGYNRTAGGAGFGGQHTDESRAKMRLAHAGVPTGRSHWKGKELSIETRLKMGQTRKGKKHTAKHNKSIATAARNQWTDPVKRERLLAGIRARFQ